MIRTTRRRTLRIARALGAGIVSACVWGLSCAGAQTGVGSDQDRSIAEYDLARDAFQNGRLREALGHVQGALRLNAHNAEASFLGATVMLTFCVADEASTDCRYAEAEQFARRALEDEPEFRDAKNTLGVILIHQKRYDDAIALLAPLAEDILYSSPDLAWGNLGWAYFLGGDAGKAIGALRRAVAAQPLFCVGHYRLGLAYEKMGELEQALKSLTTAVTTTRPGCSTMQEAFAARARVTQRVGRLKDARADLEQCLKMGPATAVGRECADLEKVTH